MALESPERRRARRVPVSSKSWFAVPTTWSVQLIDIGLGGLSFWSPHALEIDRTVFVRATLGAEPFSAQVRVCWHKQRAVATATRPRHEIGATFVSVDESSRRALLRFLRIPTSD